MTVRSHADIPPGTRLIHEANPDQEGVVECTDAEGTWVRWQITGVLGLVTDAGLPGLTVLERPTSTEGRTRD